MIKVLFLASDPTDTNRLRLGQELRDIRERLQLAKLRDSFVLESRESVRPRDISQAIFDVDPQIVHFSGHGTSLGELCFEDLSGKTQTIATEALVSLFELVAEQIGCVVLNACYSEAQAKAITEHIPFVIGMNKAIGDTAAIAFAVGFYKALGAGRSYEDAYKFGCVELKLEGIPEHLTPVLHRKKASLNKEQLLDIFQLPEAGNQDKPHEQCKSQPVDSSNAWAKIQGYLNSPKQLREMFCALYLLIKIDQYQDVESNNGLWGWSVCDAFRKKEVAISLEEEPRKASLLVSYFAQSAINEFLQSLNLHQGEQMRETLLDSCYAHQFGYFGQPRDTLISVDAGTRSQTIPQNIRHTVNSAKALLLLKNPNDVDVIQSVVNYLKTCKEDRLWSEEPFPYQRDATPDCKTCSQVLEFFSLLESSPLFFNSLTHKDQEWLKKRQSEGLNWLKGHKYQKVLWDYKVDTRKQSSDSVLTLFHTACVLYCCRFYLCHDSQRVFESSISELLALLKKEPHLGLLPVSKLDLRPHLCHTAFFVCSLFQKVSTFDDERLKLIAQSLDSIATYFNNQFSHDSLSVDIPELDHYADGWALMLYLSAYLGGAKGQGLSVEDIQHLDRQAENLTSLINEGISKRLDLNTWKVEVQSELGDFSHLWCLVYQRIIKQRELKMI